MNEMDKKTPAEIIDETFFETETSSQGNYHGLSAVVKNEYDLARDSLNQHRLKSYIQRHNQKQESQPTMDDGTTQPAELIANLNDPKSHK